MNRPVKISLIASGTFFSFLFLLISPAHASLTATPNTVNFGNSRVGSQTSPVPITLTNVDAFRNFTIVNISSTVSQFAVSGPQLPVTLTPGESLSVDVTFTASSAAAYLGTLGFTTYYGWTIKVRLSGTGVQINGLAGAPPGYSSSQSVVSGQLTVPSLLNFGTVNLGTTSSQQFNIANSGGANVTIASVAQTGANIVVNGISSGPVLPPGQVISVTASLTPSAGASAAGNITIRSDAANSPTVIAWTATTPPANPAPSTHSVDLNWDASSSDGVTGYNVYRGIASGGPYTLVASSPVETTTFTDSNLSSGETLYYVITSLANGVESAYSNQVSAIIP